MVNIGDIALTPYLPQGVVVVVAIEDWGKPYGEIAEVIMLHDHRGYPAFSRGSYRRAELTRLDAATIDFHALISASKP